jgi:hypothetical protein
MNRKILDGDVYKHLVESFGSLAVFRSERIHLTSVVDKCLSRVAVHFLSK